MNSTIHADTVSTAFMHATSDTSDSSQSWPEPEVLPFKLLHMNRVPEHDLVDKQAFDVYVEVYNLFEMNAPCLFYLTAHESRSRFALPEYAPRTHHNGLMMLIVDQDRAYEALAAFEARVHARARRLLVSNNPVPATPEGALEWDAGDLAMAQSTAPILDEPPAWALEVIPVDEGLFLTEPDTGIPEFG